MPFLTKVFDPGSDDTGSVTQGGQEAGMAYYDPASPNDETGQDVTPHNDALDESDQVGSGSGESTESELGADANLELAVTVAVESGGTWENEDGSSGGWSRTDEVTVATSTDILLEAVTGTESYDSYEG